MKQRILIGTDILLAYLMNTDYYEGIAVMFRWMRLTGVRRMIDHGTIAILTHFVKTDVLTRLRGFDVVDVVPRMSPFYHQLSIMQIGKGDERALLMQLSTLEQGHVDLLITENQLTHELAKRRYIDDKVYTIEEYIETCAAEHRELDMMRGIELQEVSFGTLSLNDRFFRTFIDEYQPYYYEWFKKKKDDPVFVAKDREGNIHALLKLKLETETERYSDINPALSPAKRLKISSLKVDYTGQKIGERFMRIVFDKAIREKVTEIYITVFANSAQRKRLVGMIQKWGFNYWGLKDDKEEVYVRNMQKHVMPVWTACYPFAYRNYPALMMPVGRTFSDMLVPSSDDRQQKEDYEPYRHAIRKMVIIESTSEIPQKGWNLLFYRKNDNASSGALVASGIVDEVFDNFETEEQFLSRCIKRSILSVDELHDYWVRFHGKPVVVCFLHNYSFGDESQCNPIEKVGLQPGMLMNMSPVKLTKRQFDLLIEGTRYEKDIVVS